MLYASVNVYGIPVFSIAFSKSSAKLKASTYRCMFYLYIYISVCVCELHIYDHTCKVHKRRLPNGFDQSATSHPWFCVSKMQGQLKPFSKSDHENVGFMVPSFSDMDNKKNGKTMRMSDTPNNEPPPIFP